MLYYRRRTLRSACIGIYTYIVVKVCGCVLKIYICVSTIPDAVSLSDTHAPAIPLRDGPPRARDRARQSLSALRGTARRAVLLYRRETFRRHRPRTAVRLPRGKFAPHRHGATATRVTINGAHRASLTCTPPIHLVSVYNIFFFSFTIKTVKIISVLRMSFKRITRIEISDCIVSYKC